MSMFHVGQKVVCIRAGKDVGPLELFYSSDTIPGEVYTIRGIDPDFDDGTVGLIFEEIRNEPFLWYDRDVPSEPCYSSDRFRPVRETNIDVFRQILIDAPKQIERVSS